MARITVSGPGPGWAAAFAAERDRLATALHGAAIEHIGSTAVPGLPAEPIIDIVAGLPEPAAADIAALTALHAAAGVRPRSGWAADE